MTTGQSAGVVVRGVVEYTNAVEVAVLDQRVKTLVAVETGTFGEVGEDVVIGPEKDVLPAGVGERVTVAGGMTGQSRSVPSVAESKAAKSEEAKLEVVA